MTPAVKFENLIVRDPALRNGRPVISGTGVMVRTVAGHYKLGLTPEKIADEMGLELAGVYAALAYYHLNKAEIEADIAANPEVTLMQTSDDETTDADRSALFIDKEEWDRFIEVLDAPSKQIKRLQDLMSRKPVWKE